MWYKAIWDSVYNIVNSLIATTKLTAVYNYDAKGSETYPYAIITTKDGTENMLDTSTNYSEFNFIIRVVNINKNVSTMEDVMRQLCDDIMTELRKGVNKTLSGTVDYFLPTSISWGWADGQEPTRVFEINVEVKKIFDMN